MDKKELIQLKENAEKRLVILKQNLVDLKENSPEAKEGMFLYRQTSGIINYFNQKLNELK